MSAQRGMRGGASFGCRLLTVHPILLPIFPERGGPVFLKLTDNDSQTDIYLNPNHIIRFVANNAGEGTLIFMSADACVAPVGEPQLVSVHENTEQVFRLISSMGVGGANKPGAGGRGLI